MSSPEYSSCRPSADESGTTVSQESTVTSSPPDAEPARCSRADCVDASQDKLWVAPRRQKRGPVSTPVPEAGEHECDGGGGLQQASESTADAVPVRDPDAPVVYNEFRMLNRAVVELVTEDGVLVVSGGGDTSDSLQLSACGVAPDEVDSGDGLTDSSSLPSTICGDGHQNDNGTGSPLGAEGARPPVDRADKGVQCDMYMEVMLCIEALKRQLSFYDKMSK